MLQIFLVSKQTPTTKASRKATKATARTAGNWQGMNWIRQEKRLAIYLRDGLACCYCNAGVEDGAQFTLDHVRPHSKSGSNHQSNLVTACTRCNFSRGDRPLKSFTESVALYINHGATAEAIQAGIRNKTARKLAPYLIEAKALIARRGSLQKVLTA